MPDPAPDPNLAQVQRVALIALGAGAVLMLGKVGVYLLTDSVAVLTDALESVINIVAAAVMFFAIRYANRPADRTHPYGHGKIEFLAIGLEGWLILRAAIWIGYEAITRFLSYNEPRHLGWGTGLLAVIGVADTVLTCYVLRMGKRFNNGVLLADGKHLLTDVISTAGVIGALLLVQWTGWTKLDPVVAVVLAAAILFMSWRLLWQSSAGLLDRSDPADDAAIRAILDDEFAAGTIRSYHKVRHRHTGAFHWVDLHLQVDGDLSVRQGHALASRIEQRIEAELGEANATAHVEPAESDSDVSDESDRTSPPARSD